MAFRNEFFTPRFLPQRIRERRSPQSCATRCVWQERARILDAPRVARELSVRC